MATQRIKDEELIKELRTCFEDEINTSREIRNRLSRINYLEKTLAQRGYVISHTSDNVLEINKSEKRLHTLVLDETTKTYDLFKNQD